MTTDPLDGLSNLDMFRMFESISTETDGRVFAFDVNRFGAVLVVAGNDAGHPLLLKLDVSDLDALRELLVMHDALLGIRSRTT